MGEVLDKEEIWIGASVQIWQHHTQNIQEIIQNYLVYQEWLQFEKQIYMCPHQDDPELSDQDFTVPFTHILQQAMVNTLETN